MHQLVLEPDLPVLVEGRDQNHAAVGEVWYEDLQDYMETIDTKSRMKDFQDYMETIDTKSRMKEEQLRTITQELVDLVARRAPMNPHEEEGSIGSDVNPFHQGIPQGYRRQRRQVDQEENLYLKVEIPEYHGSLCGDDFIEEIEPSSRSSSIE